MPDAPEDRLLELGAATVYEAAGRIGALDPRIRALGEPSLVGRALPVRCHPGDNLAVHRAVAEAQPGEVLVVAGAGTLVGYLGDILGAAAQIRGIRGAVVDGGVRDLKALAALRFPVWARGPAIVGAAKVTPGTVGEPTVCGGVAVSRGDWILADADGVVAVPAAALETTLEAAARRARAEEEILDGLRQGESTLELLGLRPTP